MKQYLFGLYPEDQKRKNVLMRHFRKVAGRDLSFAAILRILMREKVSDLSASR